MLSANTFTLDGTHSGKYGLLIAEIDADTMQSTTPFEYTISTAKTNLLQTFLFTGSNINEMPSRQFSIYTADASPLSDIVQREIHFWLTRNNGFRLLKFHQKEYQDYDYYVVVSALDKHYHRGRHVGFTVTLMFNSQYAYAPTRKIRFPNEDFPDRDSDLYFCKKRELWGGLPPIYTYPKIVNESDKEYIFPTVRFAARNVKIFNSRHPLELFEFEDLPNLDAGQKIKVDNELKTMGFVSEDKDVLLLGAPEILSKFGWGDNKSNKDFLRLANGINELKVSIDADAYLEIEFTPVVLIGF